MIIGGIAVIARGVVRQTDDIDATIWADQAPLPRLLECLAKQGISGRIPDLEAFARDNQVLLLRHDETGTPMEVTLAWLPFEREALDRADILPLGHVKAPVSSAEDLIIYKAIAWRDRDRTDIQRLFRAHHSSLDVERIKRVVGEFAAALDEPERVGELEKLIRRA